METDIKMNTKTPSHLTLLLRLSAASLVLALGLVHTASASVPPLAAVSPVTFPIAPYVNPGNLSMYQYLPFSGTPLNAALVVVLPGCGQSGAGFARDSGWMELAELRHFNLVIAEQKTANNTQGCFNWFLPSDMARTGGEAQSIAQMVAQFQGTHSGWVNPAKIFVTGLSAGGAMTAVMLATYPDVFQGGGIDSGIPYGCATNATQAALCMSNPLLSSNTSATWGNLARAAFTWTGHKPSVAIFHGSADTTVLPPRLTELKRQWASYGELNESVYGSSTLKYLSNSMTDYVTHVAGSTSTAKVKTVSIGGMTHAAAVDQPPPNPLPSAIDQCGQAGTLSQNVGVCAAYYTALFWGI